eukprot:3474914-Prymnesium_polylepis.1
MPRFCTGRAGWTSHRAPPLHRPSHAAAPSGCAGSSDAWPPGSPCIARSCTGPRSPSRSRMPRASARGEVATTSARRLSAAASATRHTTFAWNFNKYREPLL